MAKQLSELIKKVNPTVVEAARYKADEEIFELRLSKPIFGSWNLPQFVRNRYFCHSKLISLQSINSPFGFRQYRLCTFHFVKNDDEIALNAR